MEWIERLKVLEDEYTQKGLSEKLGINARSIRRYKQPIRTPIKPIYQKVNKLYRQLLRKRKIYRVRLRTEYEPEHRQKSYHIKIEATFYIKANNKTDAENEAYFYVCEHFGRDAENFIKKSDFVFNTEKVTTSGMNFIKWSHKRNKTKWGYWKRYEYGEGVMNEDE